jgi:hypothetical protein
MDQGGAYAVLDISIPDQPALLDTLDGAPRMYAIAVGANDRIYTAGRDGNFLIHSFEDPTKIELVKNALIGEDQLYAAVQDHFVFLGRQNNVVKVDVTNEQNPVVVGQGTLNRDHPDHGQVTPFGNLIFIGNDHGTGSAFFCHQLGPDTTPLTAQATYPKDNATGVPPTGRVSVLFSDYLDTETLSADTVIVRKAGGEVIDGIFTYAFNTLSFGPTAELEADTTYEVVLSEGLKDVMGNALAEERVVRFSTGTSIVVPEPPEPEPSVGGSGGSAYSGGGPSAIGGTSSGGAWGVGGGANEDGDASTPTSSDSGCAMGGTMGLPSARLGSLLASLALVAWAARRRAFRA